MRLLLLALALPLCAGATPAWTCHRSDGSRVFQDHPCDEPDAPLGGVAIAPTPRADAPNPGWCAAHQAWRDQARSRSEATAEPREAATWNARLREHERWLKAHHCD